MIFRKSYVFVLCIVLVCMCLVSCNLAEMIRKEPGETTALITIPNIVNSSQASAENILSLNGLIPIVKYEYSEAVGKGYVIRTEPEIGLSLEENSVVTLYVSNGSQLRVPDVQNINEASAKNILSLNGLNTFVQYENSADVVEGCVIKSEPQVGSLIEDGSTVTLYVSNGPTPKIPVLNNVEEEIAKNILLECKYVPVVSYYFNDNVKEGCVIYTSPYQGSEAPPNSQVTLAVSKGPSPSFSKDALASMDSISSSPIAAVSLRGRPKINNGNLYIDLLQVKFNTKVIWPDSTGIRAEVATINPNGARVTVISPCDKQIWLANEKQYLSFQIPLEDLGVDKPDKVYIRLRAQIDGQIQYVAPIEVSIIW